jgi:hypothetical protein
MFGASDFLDAVHLLQVLTSLLPLHCVLTVVFPTSAFLDAVHLLQVTAHVLGPPRRKFVAVRAAHKAACNPRIRLLPPSRRSRCRT